jgi:hypothetical protein
VEPFSLIYRSLVIAYVLVVIIISHDHSRVNDQLTKVWPRGAARDAQVVAVLGDDLPAGARGAALAGHRATEQVALVGGGATPDSPLSPLECPRETLRSNRADVAELKNARWGQRWLLVLVVDREEQVRVLTPTVSRRITLEVVIPSAIRECA